MIIIVDQCQEQHRFFRFCTVARLPQYANKCRNTELETTRRQNRHARIIERERERERERGREREGKREREIERERGREREREKEREIDR